MCITFCFRILTTTDEWY